MSAARITQLRGTIALLDACKLELNRFKPDLDRAYDFAERAFDLVGLMRIEGAAADRRQSALHGKRS
jgi:hypothetical protein